MAIKIVYRHDIHTRNSMKNILLALTISIAATGAAMAQSGRVPTPVFNGGDVVTHGGKQVFLKPTGTCQWGAEAGTGGFSMPMAGTKAVIYGCWTQQGHVIRLDSYSVVGPKAQMPFEETVYADVPDSFYK